jgi:hypothetical protein
MLQAHLTAAHRARLNLSRHTKDKCDLLIGRVASDDIILKTKGALSVIRAAERLYLARSPRLGDVAFPALCRAMDAL